MATGTSVEGGKGFANATRMELAFAWAVLGILLVLLVPLPPFVLDLLFTGSIAVSLVILLITLNAKEPLQFSTFPSVLLLVTLCRLALNVASTRQILLQGDAGEVVRAFGDFVVGGSLAVGFVVFLILVVIQFVVITKGAGRISEVAARFTLDAMPGKQLSIDADLNAGLITEEVARARRRALEAEAEFHGSMDGASKFVRGEAVAGLLVVVVNILGGVAIGIGSGLDAGAALEKYAILTIGDGLASQIPALLISIAAALISTKSSTDESLAYELTSQLSRQGRVFLGASAAIGTLGLVPGLPKIPLFAVSGALFLLHRMRAAAPPAEPSPAESASAGEGGAPDEIAGALQVDRLCVDVGYNLVPFIDASGGGSFLASVSNVRKMLAEKLGFVVPPIRIKDSASVEPSGYRILIAGQEAARGSIVAGRLLALNGGTADGEIPGIDTRDPTFGLPARWIREEDRAEAEAKGYTVVDAASVLVTHLTETLRNNAADIVSRDDVQALLERVREQAPTVVNDLIPNLLTLSDVHKVLRLLLREKVSIRNLSQILETLGDHAAKVKEADVLAELVRVRLARAICERHTGPDGKLYALTLDAELEGELSEALGNGIDRPAGPIPPETLTRIVEGIAARLQASPLAAGDAVLAVRANHRRALAEALYGVAPRLSVLSFNEVAAARRVESIGSVKAPASPAPSRMSAATT